MTKQIPSYLRLYEERAAVQLSPTATELQSLPDVLHAFERATGWSLRFLPAAADTSTAELLWSAPVVTRDGATLGHLCMEMGGADLAADGPRIELERAAEWAASLTGMLAEMIRLSHEVRNREAELAAGVPVTAQRDPARQLAQRLQGVLQGCAQSIGCQAAALYLLDSTTTQLKLRASWGLSLERLLAPPRELRGSLADLEALCGHAVTLEDVRLTPTWAMPEHFAAGLCVPVSGTSAPLGTLWMYDNRARPFTDQQVGLVEMTAGRVAADLEREMLMVEGVSTAQLRQQVARAQRWQENQLPRVSPLLPGWSLAGWTQQAGEVGGDFHDWFLRADDRLCLTVGDGAGENLSAALSAASLRAALRAYGESADRPREVLERANRLLWMGSAGDQAASAGCVLVETSTGAVTLSACGDMAMLVLRQSPAATAPTCATGDRSQTSGSRQKSARQRSARHAPDAESNGTTLVATPSLPESSEQEPKSPVGWRMLSAAGLSLGADPETEYVDQPCDLAAGETLMILTPGARMRVDGNGLDQLAEIVMAAVAKEPQATASRLAEVLRNALSSTATPLAQCDHTALVLRRMPV